MTEEEKALREDNREMLLAFSKPFPEAVAKMQGGIHVQNTDGINVMRVPAGVMAAVFDKDTNIGITAVAFGRSKFKVYLEVVIDPADGLAVISSVIDSRCTIAGEIFAQAFTEYIEKCRAFVR